jgi:hypothetical protein
MRIESGGLISIMMGIHQPQPELFSYQVNLDKRVRADYPLRRVAQAVNFTFVRAESPVGTATTETNRWTRLC